MNNTENNLFSKKLNAEFVRKSFAGKRFSGNFMYDYIFRPLSYPATVPFLRLGWSANQVTYLSGITGFAGLAALATGSSLMLLLGSMLLFISILLDHVDGNVARIQDSASYLGKFIDGVKDKFVIGLFPYALAIGVATSEVSTINFRPTTWLILGSFASLAYFAAEVTGTRLGRFVRQIALDGKLPVEYVPRPLTGLPRLVRAAFTRGLKFTLVLRSATVFLAIFILLPTARSEAALLLVSVLYIISGSWSIARVFRDAHSRIDVHRRSKNHVYGLGEGED
jgi:phosphatidylglycerophosphate synthase